MGKTFALCCLVATTLVACDRGTQVEASGAPSATSAKADGSGKSCRVYGLVTDANENGVAGMTVFFGYTDARAGQAVTDASGAYAIFDMPCGRQPVFIVQPEQLGSGSATGVVLFPEGQRAVFVDTRVDQPNDFVIAPLAS